MLVVRARSKAQPSTGWGLHHMTEEANSEGKARAGSLATVTASGGRLEHLEKLGFFIAASVILTQIPSF